MGMMVWHALRNVDLHDVPARARALEALGYDFITTPESKHDPFLPLTLVAEHTERLRFSTSVAIAFPRAPYITANLAWDLARYSGGRFVLGLGTQVKGHNERRFSVPWGPPGPRLRDYIRCIRAIWHCWQTGARPDFEGEYYRYTLTNPDFDPGPIEHPDVAIVISAVNPYNTRLAGELCDGIAVHPVSSFRHQREVVLPRVFEGARRAGRDPADLMVRSGGFIVTGRDEEELAQSREVARRRIAFYSSTRAYASILALHGWEATADELHRLSIEGRWDELPSRISDEMMEEFCAIATWDRLAAEMREKYAGLATVVNLEVEPRNPGEEAQVREIVAELQRIPTTAEFAPAA